MYFIFVFLVLIFIYLIYRSNSFIDISRFEININDDLKNFNDFKIVQISDLQNNDFKGKLEELVRIENPNVIFITGDLIDFYNTDEKIAFSLISDLVKDYLIFFVSGNHEARIKDYSKFEQELKKLGVVVLNNENFELYIENQKLNIIGLKDPRFEYFELPSRTVENEIKNFKLEGYKILLSHRPEHFEIYVKNNMDLVFTGHAHGGQIRIPFLKIGVLSPDQGIFPSLIDGIYESKNTKMIVSRGLGNSKLRLRLNNPFNLVVVSLKVYKNKLPI